MWTEVEGLQSFCSQLDRPLQELWDASLESIGSAGIEQYLACLTELRAAVRDVSTRFC